MLLFLFFSYLGGFQTPTRSLPRVWHLSLDPLMDSSSYSPPYFPPLFTLSIPQTHMPGTPFPRLHNAKYRLTPLFPDRHFQA
jgi:hypothetical protein